MYLSRLVLNPRSWSVRRDLDHPYEMHQAIMRAFPKNLEPGGERVLWRVDEHPRTKAPALLVQSRGLPDWSWLEEERGYLLPSDEPNPAVKPLNLQLTVDQTLSFRLLANPTIKTKNDGRPVREGILKEEDQRAWLERRAEVSGFRVLSVRLSPYSLVKGGEIQEADKKHETHFLAVKFDGILQVTDPAKLIAAVEAGIGSGKGFGFGLLSLAPARG